MMKTILILTVFAISILAVSCFKEDEKLTPHLPGNFRVDTIELTNLYKYQVYYNLFNGEPASVNLRNNWDLSFGSAADGWRIRLNTSCFMYATELSNGQFGQASDTSGISWKFDNSNGDTDSTAIGNWFIVVGTDTISNGKLILINRGLDESGNPRGYRQLMIDSLSNNTYYFRVAFMDGSNASSYHISRDPQRNHVLFSFDNSTDDFQEPATNTWDLLFSQYTTLLYTDLGEPYPYLVTGVLLNPAIMEVAQDSLNTFEKITYQSAKQLTYSTRQDIIGYDWKYYNFDTGAYTVRLNRVYIIRNGTGYYKLRFLGFYNNRGEKGYPSIEYQRL